MAYTMKVTGMDEIGRMLNKLGQKAGKVAAFGLYEGAGVMSREINASARTVIDSKFHYGVFVKRLPSHEEKEAIQDACGIATFDKNGSEVNTSVGYGAAGYADIGGKTKPIPMIAAAINSGTSFMNKQPYFARAVTSGTRKANEAITNSINEQYEQLINESGG